MRSGSGKALSTLCKKLEQIEPNALRGGVALGLRLLQHPSLAAYRDDPLRLLSGEYPSLDAVERALRERLGSLPPDSSGAVGAVWGALYLPAEARAVPIKIRALVLDGAAETLALRPLSPELTLSLMAASNVARRFSGRSDGQILLDLDAEGLDDSLVGAVAGDSLGLPILLALWSALAAVPLPLDLGATGAVGRGGDDRIGEVGWVEEKRAALARIGVRLIAPGEVPRVDDALRAARTAPKPAAASDALSEPLTPLVGRGQEIVALTQLLSAEGTRLVTLTGPGGVGKTRLALEAARWLSARFPDGVRTLSLAEAPVGGNLRERLAAALGTPSEHFVSRRLLLVLDNGETALSEMAALAELLSAAPGVVCLATSRVVLGLRGEKRVEVSGLAPRDAAALFVARARDADSDFLEEHDRVREIALRLEGLPLAIELAASRVRLLPLKELQERLDDALSLLTTRSRDVPARQRTMRATLEWSVSFLETEERRLLRSLSVFEGGFTARAASALLGEDALDDLGRLEEASLIRVERLPGRETRFYLLMLVREYAAELAAAEEELTGWKKSHTDYFLSEALDAWGVGRRDISRYDSYESDIENFRAMFLRLSEAATPFPTEAVAAMTRFLRRRGRWIELEDWLSRVRGRHRTPLGPGDAAKILLARAALDRLHGPLKRAARRTDAAYRLARRASDDLLAAEALAIRATLSARAGRFAEARDDLDAALPVYERCGDDLGRLAAQGNRGGVRWRAGRIAEAAEDFDAVLALARKLGGRRDEAMAGINLAAVRLALEDIPGSLRAASASLEIVPDLPNRAWALRYLGEGLIRADRPDAGRRCLEQARAVGLRSRLGDDFFREIEAILPAEKTSVAFDAAEWPLPRLLEMDWLRPVVQELLAG